MKSKGGRRVVPPLMNSGHISFLTTKQQNEEFSFSLTNEIYFRFVVFNYYIFSFSITVFQYQLRFFQLRFYYLNQWLSTDTFDFFSAP